MVIEAAAFVKSVSTGVPYHVIGRNMLNERDISMADRVEPECGPIEYATASP
jgi:hypothetical protein